jgi:uncharacterized protein (UPF0332 family)
MSYADALLDTAAGLLRRRAGQRGKLPTARVRRAVSTVYYALFHFLLDDAARAMVGAHNDARRRRNTLARSFSHAGVKTALDKVGGRTTDPGVAALLRPKRHPSGSVASPAFTQTMARAFSDLQAKRHEADYDLNASISEVDAGVLLNRAGKLSPNGAAPTRRRIATSSRRCAC